MASKVFLDANMLLDFTLKRDSYDVAKRIIELAVNGQVQAFITPSIVHIVGYWLNKVVWKCKGKRIIIDITC